LLNVKRGGAYSDHWSELYFKIQSIPHIKPLILVFKEQSLNNV